MNIEILCVGKIKEKFYVDAIAEYKKRLSKYCKIKIIEVSDEKTVENASINLENTIKAKEGEKILKILNESSYIIALTIDGKSFSSIEFSKEIESLGIKGYSSITFIIGGSIGLSENVIKKADMKLSFSNFTFPHQLMRVILLEQIYRSYKIIKNEPYHK